MANKLFQNPDEMHMLPAETALPDRSLTTVLTEIFLCPSRVVKQRVSELAALVANGSKQMLAYRYEQRQPVILVAK